MLTEAFQEMRNPRDISVVNGCRRYARIKTIKSGVIRLVKRKNKNATIPTMTSPINSFVVGLQRGEFLKGCSMPKISRVTIFYRLSRLKQNTPRGKYSRGAVCWRLT